MSGVNIEPRADGGVLGLKQLAQRNRALWVHRQILDELLRQLTELAADFSKMSRKMRIGEELHYPILHGILRKMAP